MAGVRFIVICEVSRDVSSLLTLMFLLFVAMASANFFSDAASAAASTRPPAVPTATSSMNFTGPELNTPSFPPRGPMRRRMSRSPRTRNPPPAGCGCRGPRSTWHRRRRRHWRRHRKCRNTRRRQAGRTRPRRRAHGAPTPSGHQLPSRIPTGASASVAATWSALCIRQSAWRALRKWHSACTCNACELKPELAEDQRGPRPTSPTDRTKGTNA